MNKKEVFLIFFIIVIIIGFVYFVAFVDVEPREKDKGNKQKEKTLPPRKSRDVWWIENAIVNKTDRSDWGVCKGLIYLRDGRGLIVELNIYGAASGGDRISVMRQPYWKTEDTKVIIRRRDGDVLKLKGYVGLED